jgi:putative chitinase
LKLAENEELLKSKILTSCYETCKICRSKLKTYLFFDKIIPTPIVYNKKENYVFPLFLKPEVGQGSKGTFKVNTKEESGIKSKPTVTPPDELVKAMRDYGITDPKERAHFLAQCAHESGGFSTKREIWGPTAAQKKYEGKKTLGNTETGDGKKYRGRGYIQLTGRANYTAYNKSLLARGIKDDVVTNPDLVATKFAADASCYWWKNIGTGLTKLSLAGTADSNVKKVSTRVNGGSPSNGESDRIARFKGYWASISEDNSKYA